MGKIESLWGQMYPSLLRLLEDATPSIAGDWDEVTTIDDISTCKKRFVDRGSNRVVILSTRQNKDETSYLRGDGIYEMVIRDSGT